MKLVFLGLIYLTFSNMHSQEWELKRNANNIQVYTRSSDSTKINEYKAVLIAKTNPKKVLETLTDGDKIKEWSYKTPKSKLLKKISDSAFVFWMENDFPWPVSNRDHVSRVLVSKPTDSIYRIDIAPEDSLQVAHNGNVIRMDLFKGFWLIQPLDKDSVLIIQQMYGDPKGSLPPWLVNSILVSFPYHSFENLKEILEN